MKITWSGSGPAVVLVPGVPGRPEDWEDVAARLSSDHRAGVAHLAGFHAGTPRRHYDELAFASQAGALAAALDRDGVVGATVVGHDIGGPVATLLADTRPDLVRSLVVGSCNLLADPRLAPPMRALRVPIVRHLAAGVLFSPLAFASMRRTAAPTPQPTRPGAAERANVATLFLGALGDPAAAFGPVEQAARRCPVRATVVYGVDDPFFDVTHARRVAALFPAGRRELRLLDGVGHYPHLEAPEAITSVVRSAARTDAPTARSHGS